MLEQCLETLDHQNLVLNGQAEELALLRAKLRTFEVFMDTIKQNQGRIDLDYLTNYFFFKKKIINLESILIQNFLMVVCYALETICTFYFFLFSLNFILFRRTLNAPAGSPFSPGGVTRMTSSKFQPFNPRYRSPNSRSTNPNESRNPTTRPTLPIHSFQN
jgi:hypothetical protein